MSGWIERLRRLVTGPESEQPPPMTVYGDSLASQGLADALRDALGRDVRDESIPGSYMIGPHGQGQEPWDHILPTLQDQDFVYWQGINDLNQPGNQAYDVIHTLQDRIRAAQQAGARSVSVLPYPDVRPTPGRPRDPEDAARANRQLPSLARQTGAHLPLSAIPQGAVGPDGLHLTPETYPIIAEAIRASLAGR